VRGLSAGALKRLFLHDWPGNVRELQRVVERAVLLCAGERLDASDLDLAGPGGGAGAIEVGESFRAAKGRVVRQFERSYIEHLLSLCRGNVTKAAQQAGKNRRAFFELMRKYGIAASRFRESSWPT
jgi:two-component system response regulator GlrR